MSIHYVRNKVGLGNVGSYQVSGVPFATSSLALEADGGTPTVVSFPQVTKFVIINNYSAEEIRIGFSSLGVQGTNFIELASSGTLQADWRVSRLYLISNTASPAEASVAAGLTGILAGELPNNWSGSAGVG